MRMGLLEVVKLRYSFDLLDRRTQRSTFSNSEKTLELLLSDHVRAG